MHYQLEWYGDECWKIGVNGMVAIIPKPFGFSLVVHKVEYKLHMRDQVEHDQIVLQIFEGLPNDLSNHVRSHHDASIIPINHVH
jgi:hypothetical protein